MRIIIILLALMAGLKAATVRTVFETGYYSKYLTGFGVNKYDDWMFISSVTSTVAFDRSSVSFGLVNFASPNGRWDIGDETDLVLGGSYKISDAWEVKGSYSYFFISDGKDVQRSTLGLFTKVGKWGLSGGVANFYTDAPAGGRWLANVTVSRSFKLTEKNMLTTAASYLYDTGNVVTDHGQQLRLNLGWEYKFDEHLTLLPIGVTAFVPLSMKDKRSEADAAYSFGLRYTF